MDKERYLKNYQPPINNGSCGCHRQVTIWTSYAQDFFLSQEGYLKQTYQLNFLLFSDAMWWHRSGSTLDHVVAYFVTAPRHGPLTKYAKSRVAHAPGMPGTFSPPPIQRKPLVSDPGMHHGTCVTHVQWCMSGSLHRDDGENVPSIPGACATRNFTYLARGQW